MSARVLAVGMLVLAAACTSTPTPQPSSSARLSLGMQPGTEIFFASANQITQADIRSGLSRTVHIAEMAAGDPPICWSAWAIGWCSGAMTRTQLILRI
jgi:hypothetical protein